MKLFKDLSVKSGKAIASAALSIGAKSVNSACFAWYHQPKMPKGMEKFKK